MAGPNRRASSVARRLAPLAVFAALALQACGRDTDGGQALEAPSIFFSESVGERADAAPRASIEPVDYDDEAAWLCLPGKADACEADASVTLIAPDGSLEGVPSAVNADAPIDCFYVYPTVSADAAANSDIFPGAAELSAATNQVAQFSQVCRVYAPMYRQVTLAALRVMLAGGESVTDREMAFVDVRAAWRHYMANHNDGRGVVLIGHSQGSGLLARLLDSEIGRSPQRDQIVSALLTGINLQRGDRPASASELPVCGGDAAYGCLISYGSYRAEAPPGPDAIFGAAPDGGEAVCVNPAELDGSAGALQAMLPVGQAFETTLPPPAWTAEETGIETPLVGLPGMLSAQCVSSGGRRFLAVSVNADPEDARVDEIVGDIVIDGEIQPAWGLHVLDINLALGNLVAVVEGQGAAWLAANASPGPGADAEPDQ